MQQTEDLQQILPVPRGPFAASLDGSFVVGLADQVECEVSDDSYFLAVRRKMAVHRLRG